MGEPSCRKATPELDVCVDARQFDSPTDPSTQFDMPRSMSAFLTHVRLRQHDCSTTKMLLLCLYSRLSRVHPSLSIHSCGHKGHLIYQYSLLANDADTSGGNRCHKRYSIPPCRSRSRNIPFVYILTTRYLESGESGLSCT